MILIVAIGPTFIRLLDAQLDLGARLQRIDILMVLTRVGSLLMTGLAAGWVRVLMAGAILILPTKVTLVVADTLLHLNIVVILLLLHLHLLLLSDV